jgi:glycosyltransferase involved in cell wall biosynthesis
MLGGGSLQSELKRIFSEARVLERVRFPGQVRQLELPGYYRQTDLYVSASHSDGTSISLLEALACGRPALASDIPGNREWIQPGVQGWLFPDGDFQVLAERILAACDDRPALVEMGAAARRLAEERADWSKNFPELLRAYAAAIGVQA